MIGRDGPVRPFDLIRWARRQTSKHHLKPLEGHVLLVLATYANSEAIAWPSIGRIAEDCGLKPKRVESKSGSVYWTNSAVSAALAALEDKQLIWTRQSGSGQPAKRELLFNPEPQPSASVEGNGSSAFRTDGTQDPEPDMPAFRPDGCVPSALAEQNYQENDHLLQLPEEEQTRGSVPLPRNASLPPSRKAAEEDHLEVRRQIRASLASTEAVA